MDGVWDPIPEQNIDDIATEAGEEPNITFEHLITNSPAYEWLLAHVQKTVTLRPAEPDHMTGISHAIKKSLPTPRSVSRKRAPEGVRVSLELDWDPVTFIREQEYPGRPHEAIGKAIILTGTPDDAQATTCESYLAQTWPLMGGHVLHLFKLLIRTPDHCVYCKWPTVSPVTEQLVFLHTNWPQGLDQIERSSMPRPQAPRS